MKKYVPKTMCKKEVGKVVRMYIPRDSVDCQIQILSPIRLGIMHAVVVATNCINNQIGEECRYYGTNCLYEI